MFIEIVDHSHQEQQQQHLLQVQQRQQLHLKQQLQLQEQLQKKMLVANRLDDQGQGQLQDKLSTRQLQDDEFGL